MIKLVRLDHRLLHGQVACAWCQTIGADCILIANDAVSSDEVRKTAFTLAKPTGVKLVIKTVEDSIKAINSGVTDRYKLLIVVDSIEALAALALNCPQIDSLNLGGLKQRQHSWPISNAVYVTGDEREILRELLKQNIHIEIQQVPTEAKVILNEALLNKEP